MRSAARFLVLSSAAALAVAGVAAPASAMVRHPDTLFTMTISGIDRDGTPVSVNASVESKSGTSYLSGGNSAQVPAGTYEVAAQIFRPADGNSQTLVADQVKVTGNTHVTLDAVGAVPVNATLAATGVTQQDQTVSVCVGKGIDENELAGYLLEPGGTAYVKPMTASALTTVYQVYWTGIGTIYEQAGAFKGGIPANPTYHAVPAQMAKVNLQLRPFENVTPLQAVILTYDDCGTTTESVASLPDIYTDYRTPGNWNTNLDFGPNQNTIHRDLFDQANYLSSHTYTNIFGGAVAGPQADFPEIDQSDVVFSPVNMFSDPGVRLGFDEEGKATLTLTRGATVVKTKTIKFSANSTVFSAHATKKGWYTLKVNASRWNPSGSLPAGFLLSSKVSEAWRFKFAPVTGHSINAQAIPGVVTEFLPQGLSWFNAAQGGATTPIKVHILRGGGDPVATPKYRLKTIKFQASFNGGGSWTTVAATAKKGYWLIGVPEPVTNGYVSLRSVITDSHGDSSTETIIDAYLSQDDR